MIDIIETLTRLRDERRANSIVPDAVPYVDLTNDIMRQLRQELNDLYSNGKISVQNTLNSKSITLGNYIPVVNE